jgi:lipoprotein-anchoring transpeptidase ErfK/SrfK
MGIKLGKAAKRAAPLLLPVFLAACGGGIPDMRAGFNVDYPVTGAVTPPAEVPESGLYQEFDPIAAAIQQAQVEQAVAGALETPVYSGPDFSVVSDDIDVPQRVNYTGAEPAGTILLDDQYNNLYLIEAGGTAIQYPIAMGREGHEMPDVQYVITHQREWPSWTPTPSMNNPGRTVPGGANNPLGAHALYLAELHPDGSTESTYYRIHGNNDASSIGQDASSGCVRMHNQQVQDLASRLDLDDGVQNLVRLASAQDLRHFSRITTPRAAVSVAPYRPPRNG